MSSTGRNRVAAVSLFAFLAGTAAAADTPPTSLRDPVLGLRYDIDKAHFDEMPADVVAKCRTMSDNEYLQNKMWIYALVNDNTRTYYIVAGYGIHWHPQRPKFRRYVIYDLGTVFALEGDECTIFGQARETFDARYFEEIPQRILIKLADNAASRLTQAFGGPARLSAEIRRQHVILRRLPPELNEAFKAYYRQTARR